MAGIIKRPRDVFLFTEEKTYYWLGLPSEKKFALDIYSSYKKSHGLKEIAPKEFVVWLD